VVIGEKWWKVFSRKYQTSVAQLQGLCKVPLPKPNKDRLALVDGILEYQLSKDVYDRSSLLGESLFGAQWNREESDWGVLQTVSNWIVTLYDDLGEGRIPPAIIDFLSGDPDIGGLGPSIETIRKSESVFRSTISAILTDLKFQENESISSLFGLPVESLREKLQRWLDENSTLHQHARFNALSSQILSRNLGEFVEIAAHWDRSAEELTASLDFSWYSGLIETAYSKTPELSQFDSVKQKHLVDQFKLLDRASLGHAQTGLAKSIWERKPAKNQPGEMQVLGHELNKKRRHMPIRKLIDQAGRAIQAIKPVFMMSPMSIANFLPPGKIEFDVVIFDEASQVKSVDAFGALARGRQAIVVGDTKQMPPSNFFGRDAEIEDVDNITADIESILSLFRARGAQERYLSWHYRSRHESLISVSNVEFYERKLVVFPSSGANPLATGLKFHCHPEAIYDRSRTRTNKLEAQAIARSVIDHAENKPGLSLGVVAFSVQQRDLILVEIELMRKKRPDLNDFFNRAHPTEKFFVKNLENVQGDERDCILISIGYGRNESGRIPKEFGLINQVGGERRLNVLISRAKMSMEVFSNFSADELELDANASHGLRALKHFLKYAETGELDIPRETGKAPDSPFEEEVIHALTAKGYRLEPQVGAAGYFIDIAVKDPEYHGRYLLAIECDGAAYHSSRSARDRDRLRQGVLESLGWRFHRIWSTDWFRNPQQELARVVEAIESAKASIGSNSVIISSAVPEVSIELQRVDVVASQSAHTANKYKKFELPPWRSQAQLHEAPISQLVQLIRSVVANESPVHETDVTKRLLKAFGLSRAGNRIADVISEATRSGHRTGVFHYEGGFLYKDSQRSAVIRNRSDLESSERKIELVAPEELEAALLEIIQNSFSIERSAAISSALDLLGFGRATTNIASAMNDRLDQLIQRNLIKLDGDRLLPA
jgi:very-short-patch-repair endonuclease